jgi:hypothetical protein
VPQIGGLLLLTIALLLIFSGKQFSKRAIGPVIFSSVNAVVTISLFKYDIAHFNSIAAEQIGMLAILFVYALIGRYVMSEPNPFGRVMKDRKILLQVTADAIGGVCQSFAFLYLPPSILMAVKRSTSVFWALLSGHFAFHEKHFLRKSLTVIMLISSLTLLIHGA